MGNITKTALSLSGRDYSQNAEYTLYRIKKDAAAQKKAEPVGSAQSSYENAKLKRMARAETTVSIDANGKKTFKGTGSFSAFDKTYTESLKNSRTDKKKNANEKKKLQYSYKKISSEIIRSKTPVAAKSAAAKARREIIHLRRQKSSGKYDPEEIEAAITHAKSMERIAKKKAAHLEQEEMIEISDDGSSSLSLSDALNEGPSKTESSDSCEGQNDQIAAAQQEAIAEETAAMQEELAAEMSEEMEYMMAELQEEMQEMMEELDLMETLSGPVGKMSPDDFKLLQTKHRTDEAKAIAKADADYLKVIFDKYQKERTGGSIPGASAVAGAGTAAAPMSVTAAPATISVAIPSAEGMAVDVSL